MAKRLFLPGGGGGYPDRESTRDQAQAALKEELVDLREIIIGAFGQPAASKIFAAKVRPSTRRPGQTAADAGEEAGADAPPEK